MRDHSHSFEMALFLTASALFGVASMYASQFAPLLFADSQRVQEASSGTQAPLGVTDRSSGTLKISLSDADELPPYTEKPQTERRAQSTDSVVPNAQSCPSGTIPNLAGPLGIQPDTRGSLARAPAPSGGTLGTGTGCPPAPPDAQPAAEAGPVKIERRPKIGTDIPRSGASPAPAANP